MIKNKIKKIAENIPLSFYMKIIHRDVVGLSYHIVSYETLPHITHLYAFKTPEMFENDLIYLKNNFNLISYEQLEKFYNGSEKLKPRSLLLSFDDGFIECYSIVRPLLMKYYIPSIFFITTNFIDNQDMSSDLKASLCVEQIIAQESRNLNKFITKLNATFNQNFTSLDAIKNWVQSIKVTQPNLIDRLCGVLGIDVEAFLSSHQPYLTTKMIKQMGIDGFTIGAHSLTHTNFNLLSNQEIAGDIIQSCQIIQSLTEQEHIPFAFPYSSEGMSGKFLNNVRANNDNIGLFFGGDGVQKNNWPIINRMCGDSPIGIEKGSSNLVRLIKHAYIEELSRIFHNTKLLSIST